MSRAGQVHEARTMQNIQCAMYKTAQLVTIAWQDIVGRGPRLRQTGADWLAMVVKPVGHIPGVPSLWKDRAHPKPSSVRYASLVKDELPAAISVTTSASGLEIGRA